MDATTDLDALAAARSRAMLPSCAPPVGAAARTSNPLSGVVVPCLDGSGSADLGTVTSGRSTLINVWASWCAPCRSELPSLAAYAVRPGAAAVLTVNVRDDQVAAVNLLAELGLRLPAVTDPRGAVHAVLRGPPALLASYVLRSDGTLAPVGPPTPFRDADEVSAAVQSLG
jgi:thiol-disulfide isomerase/thioredoxin